MNQEELNIILEKHKKWLRGEEGGERAYLNGACLNEADLRGADLRRADLREANLTGANLREAYLERANLREADLTGAYLTGADLREAYLGGAYLEGAYLTGAYLREADLRESDLRGANLTGAYLRGAYLEGIKGKFIFTFQIGKHFGYYCDDYVKIGCKTLTLKEWQDNYKEIGERENYSDVQISQYGLILCDTIPKLIEVEKLS